MMNGKIKNLTSVLNYSLGTQNYMADINKLISDRIRNQKLDTVWELFDELIKIAALNDIELLAQKETRLDEISSRFSMIRIELMKEKELLSAFRVTNDSLIEQLAKDILEATELLKDPDFLNRPDSHEIGNALKNRIGELNTTLAVAKSFSAQIKLSEDNLNQAANRIWDALMHIMPLIRGRLTAENSTLVIEEIKRMMTL